MEFTLAEDRHQYGLAVQVAGKQRYFSLHKSLLNSPKSLEEADGQVVLIEEVTELKVLEQELVHSEHAEYVVSPGTYDQKHIDRIGKLHNCIAYGPGILDLAHKPDEYVGVEDMIDSVNVMGRSLIDLLVQPEA